MFINVVAMAIYTIYEMYSVAAYSSLLQCHYHEDDAFFSLNIIIFYWVAKIVFINVIATPTYTFWKVFTS